MKDRKRGTSNAWAWALGLALVLALVVGVASAGKNNATGWILYHVSSPYTERGLWIMRADGSDQEKLVLGGQVGRKRHNGKLWGIYRQEVGTHVHPDGLPNEELFVRAEGDAAEDAIQLTDDASFQFSYYRWCNVVWGHDDEFVSWVGIQWGTDSNGDPSVFKAGIFRAELEYDGNGNIVGLAETPWLAAEADTYAVWQNNHKYYVTEVRYGHDWSPNGQRVVWQHATSDSSPGYLHITDIADPNHHWRVSDINSARRGVWSSQNEIAWKGAGGIWLMQPPVDPGDYGTDQTLLYEPKNVKVSHLHWSPDGEFLTYQAHSNRIRICTLPIDKPSPAGINVRGYPTAWVPE
ncbi:MAG: hypothetical protein ACYTG3_18560 [Planctomycetota bacterium]|jgi:hypothetical protein